MAVQYTIDLHQTGRQYPHYWEFCVGSCHAPTLLREDVRSQIRKAHEEIGFRYLRFHGLFDDDMSVVIQPQMPWGKTEISFYNIDCIFDFLLDTGMKPFVELGFMPEAYASGTQQLFHYKGNVTLPKSDEVWADFIRLFTGHLLERYGREEVESWFFEVWNEPNLHFFFDGTQEDYFHLYEITARAVKSVDGRLRVGGPATSINAWIPEFKAFCAKNHVPVDFISTHHYPSDDPLSTAGMNGPGTKGAMMDQDAVKKMASMSKEEIEKILAQVFSHDSVNPRDILAQMTRKAKEEAGELPLYYTEWNGSREFDTEYQSAFILQTLAYNEGLVEGYSYWTVTDIFEEQGMKNGPFKNEFGIQTNEGIAKPSYRAFQALHEAGDVRIDAVPGGAGDGYRTAEVLVLQKPGAGETTAFVYNHDINRREITAHELRIILEGSVRGVEKAVIDANHTSPIRAWEAMGKPAYPNKEQIKALHEASKLCYEDLGAVKEIAFTAEPESVIILKIKHH
jgi:xylan 1,4-beta-xylosidase